MNSSKARSIWGALRVDGSIGARLHELRGVVGADGASILLLDGPEMRFALADGLNAAALDGAGSWERAIRIPLSAEKGINPIAALMGKTLCLQQMDERHNRSVDESLRQQTRSILAVPLVAGENVIGTLSVINPHAAEPGPAAYQFTPADVELAEQAASHISALLDQRLGGGVR